MLKGKKILIGVTGSIAAYKVAHLVRLLIKNGAEVKVIMTDAATKFISPLTLGTLSKNKVLTNLFNESEWENHVMLGRWADVMLMAPLSCNTLAKMANGICDNLLLAVYYSAVCPVMVAPAMDEDMWKHPATTTNIETLKKNGNHVLQVNSGELASGLSGEGRMQEPEEILEEINNFLSKNLSLKDKKVLITAGPTYEAIDPVRFIGNHSTGKMGLALANEAAKRGADVVLVIGPNSLNIPSNITVEKVTSAAEMLEKCLLHFDDSNIAIMSAAVADFTPETVADQKIKKDGEGIELTLKKTTDILKTLGQKKKEDQCLIGFALETNNEKENALKKLEAKNADFIILNSLRDKGAGFGGDTNKITIFDKQGKQYEFPLKSKEQLAGDILDLVENWR